MDRMVGPGSRECNWTPPAQHGAGMFRIDVEIDKAALLASAAGMLEAKAGFRRLKAYR